MRQLTFKAPGRLVWDDVAAPRLSGGDDALVRPVAVATCDLDAAVMSGRAPLPGPFAFGHEFVAEVIDVADGVSTVHAGDLVIVPFQVSCGVCERCRRGLTASCETVGAGAAFGMAPIARREWGGAERSRSRSVRRRDARRLAERHRPGQRRQRLRQRS
ncbi:MAG: alcohol dehydrogenase catalytic domain-containing protein [Acidimicrobiia bacterium]